MTIPTAARTFPKLPMPGTLCALAATYPLIVLAGMIAIGFTVPGVDSRFALMIYAGLMLTFMGAVYWGLAICEPPAENETGYWGSLRQWRIYASTFAPGLATWIGMLLPMRAGAWLLIAAYGGLILYDIRCIRMGEAPSWFLTIRLVLAVIASLALFIGIILVRG